VNCKSTINNEATDQMLLHPRSVGRIWSIRVPTCTGVMRDTIKSSVASFSMRLCIRCEFGIGVLNLALRHAVNLEDLILQTPVKLGQEDYNELTDWNRLYS
jgi:hypothetical protein